MLYTGSQALSQGVVVLTDGIPQIREGFIVDEDEEDDAEDSDERRRRRKKRRRAEREQEEVLDEEDLDLIGEANPNFQRREETQVCCASKPTRRHVGRHALDTDFLSSPNSSA